MKPTLDTSLAYKYFMSYRLFDGQRFDEVIVPYLPQRSAQKKVEKQLKKNERKLYLGLLLFSFLSIAVAHVAWPVLALVAIGACVPLAMSIFWSLSPTHIALSPNGVRLYHIHWFGDKTTNLVSWKKIAVATVSRGKSLGMTEDWLDFRTLEGASAYRIRLAGVTSGEHRRRLLAAVKQFIPLEKIDMQLQDSLNPVKLTTHTALWLEVLSSSPKRLHEGMLERETLVANGRYRIKEPLGVGGQGTAYLAEQLQPDGKVLNEVVLKEFVLPAEASLRVNRKAFETIEREAELLEKISHPQVVSLLDLFVDDHRAYLALEYVPGASLRQIVQQDGPLPEQRVAELGVQMCDVLAHLHGQSPAIIHRDFTPENLILQPDGLLKLIDFNVAQQLESTATRTVVGKHSFISPEQFRGRASIQSDLYALGATLYFLLTAKDPEPISKAKVKLDRSDISAAMDEAIAKTTELEESDRIPNALELKELLLRLL